MKLNQLLGLIINFIKFILIHVQFAWEKFNFSTIQRHPISTCQNSKAQFLKARLDKFQVRTSSNWKREKVQTGTSFKDKSVIWGELRLILIIFLTNLFSYLLRTFILIKYRKLAFKSLLYRFNLFSIWNLFKNTSYWAQNSVQSSW